MKTYFAQSTKDFIRDSSEIRVPGGIPPVDSQRLYRAFTGSGSTFKIHICNIGKGIYYEKKEIHFVTRCDFGKLKESSSMKKGSPPYPVSWSSRCPTSIMFGTFGAQGEYISFWNPLNINVLGTI